MEDGEPTGLRQSLDEGAGDIGESAGSDLPETFGEVRSELPDSVDAVLNGGRPNADLSLAQLLEGTPLSGVLDSSPGDEEASADD